MKALHTFYYEKNPSGGFPDLQHNLMSFALSLFCIKDTFQVKLCTDAYGRELLIEKLGLPYNEVAVKSYSDTLHIKAQVAAEQTEPVLLVDGDLYWWQYGKQLANLMAAYKQKIGESVIYNTGIVGGSAFDGKAWLATINDLSANNPELANKPILEDLAFSSLYNNREALTVISPVMIEDYSTMQMANFKGNLLLTHLVGLYKQTHAEILKEYFERKYPEWFAKIWELEMA